MMLDVRRSEHHSIFHIKNPTRCNSLSKFYLYLCEAQHVLDDIPPSSGAQNCASSLWFCIRGGLSAI